MAERSYRWPTRPEGWDQLQPGTRLTIVKRIDIKGDVVEYPGIVVPGLAPEPWVEIEAHWTAKTVSQGPLTFEPGDVLREFFSCEHPYDVFAVYTPDHVLKGWYANVTWPSWLEDGEDGLRLIWHDLVLDVVADADGKTENLDEDELDESGLRGRDPALYRAILDAREEILSVLAARTGPFGPSMFTE